MSLDVNASITVFHNTSAHVLKMKHFTRDPGFQLYQIDADADAVESLQCNFAAHAIPQYIERSC